MSISPEVFFIDMNGFEYPFLFEEFIEGTEIIRLDSQTLELIGSIIARINNVPLVDHNPFEVREVNYLKDIDDHERLYKTLEENDHNREWFAKTQELINLSKNKLTSAVKPDKSMLIRRDSNPANFIITKDDIRMVDWEVARVDDPTITLASFINELMAYDIKNLHPTLEDMEVVKKAFLEKCPIKDFDKLLNNRLLIEQLGGLVWGYERIDSLLKGKLRHEDQEDRLNWYKKVVSASGNALESSLKA
jgi:thiamine kinase-like enzyme